ncbi:MAG: PAS domain S-box protein [Gammaproteobacteria bacterium]|nr:PAS domain S-box protein [Gammaproteobacteria bacterium]
MPIAAPPSPVSHFNLFKGFLGILLVLLGILTIVGAMHYYSVYATERSTREASENLNVDLARRMINSDITNVVSDLTFLAAHIESQGLLDATPSARRYRIGREFLVLAERKQLYDQIRYLDETGHEVVRVNYNSGQPKIVPGWELQDKADRYYFSEALTQPKGGIYLSPLDLNIEEGKIEYPIKPMMRFGTPIFDDRGNKRGIILLNYFGQRLINNFTQAAANIADHVQLVNQDGYWLSSPLHSMEWGFMLGKKETFKTLHPEAWKALLTTSKGQFQTSEGLFTYTTVTPLQVALDASTPGQTDPTAPLKGGFWKIVSQVSSRDLSATMPLFIQNHLTLYLAIFGLALIGSWLLALSRHRHHLTEAQREYEQRFRHTLEKMDLAAVALNRNGIINFCNDYFLGMSGWHREQVVGMNWLDLFVPEENRSEVNQVIEKLQTPDVFPAHYENHIKTRTGELRLIAWNNTLSYDALGNVIGVTGIGDDITEQRRGESELRKLSQAVEQSPSVVMITDREGMIEYVNPKFTAVSGYEYDEVIGKNPRFLKSGETTSLEYDNLWHNIYNGLEWRGEFHNKKKSGELYWESASISCIRNPGGEITHLLAVKEDITEKKRLEAEVETRNQELARSQALAAMGRMASMIAHDLRNPLSSVKMTLQILGKQPGREENAEAKELRQISLDQIRYMEEILSDMLTYSRPDALKPEWIAIDRVIYLATSLCQKKIDEQKIQLTTNFHPGLPTLHADADKLRQVFSNLITNAEQACENQPSPKIHIDAMIELGEAGTAIRVEICDNGYGLPEDDMERLFEPFFTTRAKGTGLGLAIVKRITDQHQGSIFLQKNHPQGSCAVVVLPINPQPDEAPEILAKTDNCESTQA